MIQNGSPSFISHNGAPPLDLDGCLGYICSRSLRLSRSSFSLTDGYRTLNKSWVFSPCWTLSLAAIPSSTKPLEALRFPRPLLTTLQISYLPWTLIGVPSLPLYCLALSLTSLKSMSRSPRRLLNSTDHGSYDFNPTGGDP
jgi:hypothetical protein